MEAIQWTTVWPRALKLSKRAVGTIHHTTERGDLSQPLKVRSHSNITKPTQSGTDLLPFGASLVGIVFLPFIKFLGRSVSSINCDRQIAFQDRIKVAKRTPELCKKKYDWVWNVGTLAKILKPARVQDARRPWIKILMGFPVGNSTGARQSVLCMAFSGYLAACGMYNTTMVDKFLPEVPLTTSWGYTFTLLSRTSSSK